MSKYAEEIIKSKIKSNLKLAEKIHSRNQFGDSSSKAYSLIITALELIEGRIFKEEELLEIITDDRDDGNIDAVVFGKDFINIYSVSKKTADPNELNSFKKAIEDLIINDIRETDNGYFNNLNEKIKNNLEKIYNKKNPKIKAFAVYKDATAGAATSIKKIKNNLDQNVKFEFYNYDNLLDKCLESENFLEEFTFEIDESKTMEHAADVLIFKARLVDLLKLQDKSHKQGLDLFNKNVRIFLKKQKLKNDLKNTIEEDPGRFYLLHNGITITTPQDIGGIVGGNIVINEPQIVNGAQTVSSLYEEYKDDLLNNKLEKAFVVVKIISANEEFTKKVCETSNTQIPIKLWDLRANDDIQKKIELYFSSIDYCYLRKSGQTLSKHKNSIRLEKFIQYFYSVYFYDSAGAKNKKKQLFKVGKKGLYNKIEKKLSSVLENKVEELDKLLDIIKFLEGKIKLERNEDKKRLLKDANMHLIEILFIRGKNKFDDAVKFLEEYVKEQINNNQELNNNKIFTKTSKTREELFKNII